MKKMSIYEPAMCCDTGLCGVSVDPELLRISTVLSNLKKNGIIIARYNLTSSPQEFVTNLEVNKLIMNEGIEILPITIVDDKIIKTGGYPSNDEIASVLGIDSNMLGEQKQSSGGCCCSGGSCC